VSVLFASVLFLNALLLFWVQPLFAKMVLPVLGGSPSVWTACVLFFQAALLLGYAYSHAGLRWLGIGRHAALHVFIVWLPLLLLPIEVTSVGAASAAGNPVSWLLMIAATGVGLPFVVLSSTAPLLQRWFSAARVGESDPYWLYAASNAGSLVALLAFPTLLEPSFPSREQAVLWKYGYAIVATALTICAVLVVRAHGSHAPSSQREAVENPGRARPSWRDRLGWLALSFAPSSLMLGVTTYISTDVAAVPLLWVLPLACYLLTFIVAFGGYSETSSVLAGRMLPRVLLPLVFVLLLGVPVPLPLWITIPLHIAAFSVLAFLCHAELARCRPGVHHLTEFYLWLSVGGMAGGAFNTLVAPQVFTSVAEYPIAIAISCLLCGSRTQFQAALRNPRLLARPALAAGIAAALLVGGRLDIVPTIPMMALLGAPVLMGLSVARDTARFALTIAGLFAALLVGNAVSPAEGGHQLHTDRTFFGVYRVRADAEGHFVALTHGTTVHGSQVMDDRNPEPLAYYHRQSPIGQVFAAFGTTAHSVGVIGLGAGTLAAYVQPGASWTFYEIDEAIERIARDTRFFHYLDNCGTQCLVVLGDARLSLAQGQPAHDVLVLDAFSSDAIPMHLLTTEALHTYESSLAAGGILVFHISNRHIQLRPVLARLARDRGLTALARLDSSADTARGYQASHWVVMARSATTLDRLSADSRWRPVQADDARAWSDDFSNIWTELR
jgi:spermidine synthase